MNIERNFEILEVPIKGISKDLINLLRENKEKLHGSFNVEYQESNCIVDSAIKVKLNKEIFPKSDDFIIFLIEKLKEKQLGETSFVIEVVEVMSAFKEAEKNDFDSLFLYEKNKLNRAK